MKVRDLIVFLAGCNPEATIGILDDDNLLHKLNIHGWIGNGDGESKKDCSYIVLN